MELIALCPYQLPCLRQLTKGELISKNSKKLQTTETARDLLKY